MSLRCVVPLVTVLALACAACVAAEDHNTAPSSTSPAGGTPARSALDQLSGPLVVAVGDIACEPGSETTSSTCRQAETAKLAESYEPEKVLALGDLQYEDGELSGFRGSYDSSWGALRSITRPVPGNHEYHSPDAAGYFTYFGNQQPGSPGYYAFDIGSWRVYALNSNCDDIDCDRQVRWLDEDMAGNPRRCTVITMHHPRYSSAEHGSDTSVIPFWEVALRHRADLALAGHDHDYERFRKMDSSGSESATGIASFVSGAGGKTLYEFRSPEPGSVARYNRTFGVLALRLGEGRYAWEYRTIDDDVVDSGVGRCA